MPHAISRYDGSTSSLPRLLGRNQDRLYYRWGRCSLRGKTVMAIPFKITYDAPNYGEVISSRQLTWGQKSGAS